MLHYQTDTPMRSIMIMLLLASSIATAQQVIVTVKNPASFDRPHETIGVPLARVTEILGSGDVGLLSVHKDGVPGDLAIQVTASEVLFQCDCRARATQRFVITYAREKFVPRSSVVSGLFAVPREDYPWENDRIAFRMYGPAMAADVNNGVDVWTKRVHYPIVYKWYKEAEGSAPGKDSYHQDKGEGADFFSVGRSLGAGGSGIMHNGTLLQPGVFRSWKTLANGPIRVSFMLTYIWHLGVDSLTEERTITLDAGENLNRMEVCYRGGHGSMSIAAGLVKRAGTVPAQDAQHGILSLWGPTVADPLNGELGTAVVFPRGADTGFTEDKDQYLITATVDAAAPFVYYAGAGWTGNGVLRGSKDWSAYLTTFAQRLAAPLTVNIAPGK